MFLQKISHALSGLHNAPMKQLQMATKQLHMAAVGLLLSLAASQQAQAIPEQEPLFLASSVTPVVMLTMDKDHQLYYKAYNDYSDFTDPDGVPRQDGQPDKTYVHKYTYYGYFESRTCYKYDSSKGYFTPEKLADADGYCSGFWAGNFLNWATMTRLDIVRKILYGGMRYIDSDTETVLERAFLPNDAHSFAKYYKGPDVAKLVPISGVTGGELQTDGITLCNTTLNRLGKNLSQDVTDPPLILVAKGNYSLWASNERGECRWGDGTSGDNGNIPAKSGIDAYKVAPKQSQGVEFAVRVKVCTDNVALIPSDPIEAAKSNCKKYPLATFANKPIGLLQKYGEGKELKFGLLTGSYTKNKSGGMLRKNVSDMLGEVNTTTYGTFVTPPTGTAEGDGNIVKTLNKLRLYGYRYDGTEYIHAANTDNCDFQLSSFNEGDCSNWGNPQSEIYYEALRYLSGTSPTSEFIGDDTTKLKGLTSVKWAKPVTDANYCAPLSILQISGSSSSYDVGAQGLYKNPANIGIADQAAIDKATDLVGDREGITNSRRFVGKLPSTNTGDKTNYQICSAKVVDKLSGVSGICPEAPRFEGGYSMVGLARIARTTGIPLYGVTKGPQNAKVRTFGVAMASAIPKVEVIVPGTEALKTPQKVIIQPACRNASTIPTTSCALVDFKVISHQLDVSYYDTTVTTEKGTLGKLYINWEDSEQGADYDQDMWGIMTYFVTSTQIIITTQMMQKSTSQSMGFGYILSGSKDKDGFHVHSGVNYFVDNNECLAANVDASKTCTCTLSFDYNNPLTAPCTASPLSRRFYPVASAAQPAASFLQSPLYYAAKWGGYSEAFATQNAANLDVEIAKREPDDSYFFATSPQALADNMETAFSIISKQRTGASGLASNNNYLANGTYIFRAEFDSNDWSGAVKAYAVDADGNLIKTDGKLVAKYSTDQAGKVKDPVNRKVYVASDTLTTEDFRWNDKLSADKKSALKLSTETSDANAQMRVDWLRGSAANEIANGFRKRPTVANVRNVLGDFVNSAPVYVGANNYHYENLPEKAGGTTYRKYVETKASKTPKIFIGGNDGMVHAFDASNSGNMLNEVYTYIPSGAFPKLATLTDPKYGSSVAHKYVVDGPIVTGDVYIDGKWRTIIVGTLGAGGRGVYALEVMNDGPNGTSGVYDDKPKILFELSEKTNPQLGYVLGKPVIAPMADGSWAVVFGNGDSSGTTSSLFVVDIANPQGVGSKTKVYDTKLGSGLSAPSLLPNGIGQAVTAYAGDLLGNLYRFDFSGTAPGYSYLLFTAEQNKVAQPIFAAPTLGANTKRDNRTMVYFGTGKYYDKADATDTLKNSYYAILDVGKGASPVPRTRLAQKTYSGAKRTMNTDPVDWAKYDGWYLDFDASERIISTALLIEDKLIFPTYTPSTETCGSGGGSWIMQVTATGNQYINAKIIDENIPLPGDPILSELNIAATRKDPKIFGSATSSGIKVIDAPLSGGDTGRRSWRQLR